jgi:hypothetical protein
MRIDRMIGDILSKIQKELKSPKSKENTFGHYKYRSCEDILNAVKPLLPEGCFITITDDILLVGDRYYVEATAKIFCKPETDTENYLISVKAVAREEETKKGMDAAQITGAASSYARKYALNGLLMIDDTADPDSADDKDTSGKLKEKIEEGKGKKVTPQPGASSQVTGNKTAGTPGLITEKEKAEALGFIEKEGLNKDLFKKYLHSIGKIDLKFGNPSLSTMKSEDFGKMIAYWQKTVEMYQEWRKKGATT